MAKDKRLIAKYMSGHSKWSKVKHQKESTDRVKGKIFTKLANAITLSVKLGNGIADPNFNVRLRFAIDKARSFNMPKEKIALAILRGTNTTDGAHLEEVLYEAFGPGGVGILIETATDNRPRTVSALKNLLDLYKGVLATTGAVSHLFESVGLLTIQKSNDSSTQNFVEIAIDAGVIDFEENPDEIYLYTHQNELHKIKEVLEKASIPIVSAEIIFRPTTKIPISDTKVEEKVLDLLSKIEDLDDVQRVFASL